MNEASSAKTILTLARQLLIYEAGAPFPQGEPLILRVSEKLRGPLSTLAGTTGFRTLFVRALAQVKLRSDPNAAIQALTVGPDGALQGFGANHNDEAMDTGTMLIAQVLGPLGLFIGEELVVQIVRQAWPDLPATGPDRPEESKS